VDLPKSGFPALRQWMDKPDQLAFVVCQGISPSLQEIAAVEQVVFEKHHILLGYFDDSSIPIEFVKFKFSTGGTT